ncbi:MAG: peptidase C25 [Bacteroidales bacterium]|nr:peptidase C25 [Bacteroidales bacterium]
MKHFSLFLIALLIWSANFASGSWTKIDNAQSPNTKVKLLNSTEETSVIQFNVNAYQLHRVMTPQGLAFTVKIPDGTPLQIKGTPNLPKLSASLIIPNDKQMQAEVQYSDYIEINNIEIAPSKGVITRNIDPATVAYAYGEVYNQNNFFPGNLSELNKPYIIRNYRGVAVWVQPVQYNPITKTLRIYKTIVVKITPTGNPAQINALSKAKGGHTATPEFQNFYQHNFLNYNTFQTKYTPIEEGTPGRMLVISYGSFMTTMQPFVDWKNQKGIFTEMVDVSTIGNAAAIKTYVENYYSSHSDFCYLLLVGDNAQVPTSSTGAGDSDNNYGYLAGSDHRIDIFVGRFSAESTADVTTQVDRTIHYEKDITSSESWMQHGLVVASDQGGGSTGDDGESDIAHENNIKTDYLNYGYTDVATCYQGTGEDVSDISAAINANCGVITYTGHGDTQMWYSVDPSGYTNTHVNALTNNNHLPFIFTVACLSGDFASNTCFGEAWQRATNSGNPTGAIANIASTINQTWNSPMCAQDEMVDILVESYTNNIKRTFGGLSANGWGQMIDEYVSDGENMADTWTVFGDASLMVRTKQPQDMTITHASGINVGSSSFNVSCDVEGALVSITKDNVILGTEYVNSGAANVALSPSITGTGNILVTVTAYNKVTYQQLVPIVQSTNPPVCDFSGTPTTITAGESVQFTDLSTEYPTTWA